MANNVRDRLLVRLISDQGDFKEKRMVVRTTPSCWRGSVQPIIIPFSIHSAIHEGPSADFKIISLLRVIKSNALGKITLLFCEGAHLQVLSLKYKGDINAAKYKCRKDAEALFARYKDELIGCDVVFWEDFVNKNLYYDELKENVMHLFENDAMMRQFN